MEKWLFYLKHLGLWTLIVTSTEASSNSSPTIRRAYYVSEVKVEILTQGLSDPSGCFTSTSEIKHSPNYLPGSVLHSDDSFLLHISIPQALQTSQPPEHYNDNRHSTWFTLSLHPTSNILHPEAKITYHSTDPLTGHPASTTKRIVREEVLAYSGWVIEESQVDSWKMDTPRFEGGHGDPRVIGWARIVVHQTEGMASADNLEHLVWEGAFEADGQVWHVKALDSYRRVKRPTDCEPIPSSSKHANKLVAWTEVEAEPAFEPPGTQSSSGDSPSDQASAQSDKSLEKLPQCRVNHESQRTRPSDVHQSSNLQRRMLGDTLGISSNTNYVSSIGSTDGCPKSSKVVYIGIAADCTYVSKYGSQNAARLAILTSMNSVSSVYERAFNVSLAIIEINMQDSSCPSQASSDTPWNVGCPDSGSGGLDLNARLSTFSKWRAQKGGGDGAGLWHLMSACPNGSEVGVAWLGTLCKVSAENGPNGETTSGTGVTAATPDEWQVIAHEIGHNFGAIHDCDEGCSMTDACCPSSTSSCSSNTPCIMTATSTSSISSFSPCSIGNICSTLKSGLDTSCVSEPGQHYAISLNQCGNGILEAGEECDPGLNASPCCQWGVCKFAPGAVCDPTHSSCCSSNCQIAPSGTACQFTGDGPSAQSQTCTGNSPDCPNASVSNGQSSMPDSQSFYW